MKKTLQIMLFFVSVICKAQPVQQASPQLKTFQQFLTAANLQLVFPKDFKEIKALHTPHIDVDYAMEIPDANFQVWYLVKSVQQYTSKFKASEDNLNRALANPDSLYSTRSLLAAKLLAGKDNFTVKNLPADILNVFHADRGKSYQLNLYDRPETNHYQYGLLISLQKSGAGYISMLFLSNENGPDFYNKVNKAYYSVRFN